VINVSKPYLPPLGEYYKYLEDIWSTGWITNNGPLLTELETQLKAYLSVENLQVVSSGTVGLQIAIAALGLSGEVITTAFSHVTTVNAVIWNGIEPVFADIEKKSYTIDPYRIEAAISEKTTGIIATHVFGYPCHVRQIERIARRHNLKVIYDSAHAFGVKIGDQSLLNYGDVSVVSFHATKIYHMVEGGAIISKEREISEKCTLLRTFGLQGGTTPVMAGLNGKNSELHAAIGLCNLKQVQNFINKQKRLSDLYRALMKGVPVEFPEHTVDVSYNYAYFPIVFPSKEKMISVKDKLDSAGIHARRYFYPSLNDLPYTRGSYCPIAESISERILCLPLYYELSEEDVIMIANFIVRQFEVEETVPFRQYSKISIR